MNLADDALRAEAYDGDLKTYTDAEKAKYLKIDPQLVGKMIRVTENTESFELYLCDENKKVIQSIRERCHAKDITIPEGVVYLDFSRRFYCWVYEVELLNEPSFEVELHYPTITSEGIQKAYNVIKNISYFDTSEKKKYSLDDGKTWLDYNNEEIRLNIGDKIIAKGIDEYGEDSRTKTYTAVLPSDAIGEKAYDGDESTYYEENKSFAYSYVELDNSIIGKKVKVIQNQESFEIYICNENKEVINKIYKYGWGNSTTVVEIPEGAKYIGIFSSKRIYEFIPIN